MLLYCCPLAKSLVGFSTPSNVEAAHSCRGEGSRRLHLLHSITGSSGFMQDTKLEAKVERSQGRELKAYSQDKCCPCHTTSLEQQVGWNAHQTKRDQSVPDPEAKEEGTS